MFCKNIPKIGKCAKPYCLSKKIIILQSNKILKNLLTSKLSGFGGIKLEFKGL